ncbi:hypothetical protein ABTP48_19325, partial [Acinetobacter baumannii]
FQLSGAVDGSSWFMSGGAVQSMLNKTASKRVYVLSLSLRYLNDLALLDIDWQNRLRELNSLGYNILLVGGSLSNSVSQTLFNGFVSKA